MPDTSALLTAALDAHRSGKLAEAAELYQQILAAEPQHVDALHLMGVLANQHGKPELAIDLIGRAIAVKPGATAFHNNLGNAFKARGDVAEAEKSYRKAIVLDSRNADAHLNLGVLMEGQSRFEEARDAYERALKHGSDSIAAQIGLGNALVALDEPTRGLKHLKRAIAAAPQNAAAHTAFGNALMQEGRREDAKASHERAVELAPDSPDAHFNLGNWFLKGQDHKAAIARYERSLELKPRQADALNNLGMAYAELKDNEAAERNFLRALEYSPAYVEAHFNLGNVMAARKRHREAIECFDRALRFAPAHAKALHNRGAAHEQLGDTEAAERSYRQAVVADPGYREVLSNLGMLLAQRAEHEGIEILEGVVKREPKSADAHFNLGNALAANKRHREAMRCFDGAIQLSPSFAKAFQNRGAAQEQSGETEAAERSYRQAVVADPGYREVQSNLGMLLAQRGSREGIEILEEIVRREPESAEAHSSLGIARLAQGDYLRGWPEYEWRWAREKFTSPRRGFSQPQWRGEPLTCQTILLHAEQGYGDTLQFSRYAPLVAARGGRVVLEVQPALERLLARMPGITACVGNGQPLPPFDLHCPLMSLPLAFATTLETIPPPVSLEEAPDKALSEGPGKVGGEAQAAAAAHGDLKVGLVWAGNPKHHMDALRSVQLSAYLPLAAIDGVWFASLQLGAAAEQASQWPGALSEPLREARDFADTAAVIYELDLVITIDSALAHLAGTLGKPVWVLQSPLPDWRWGLAGDTTPWYPSARLFRRTASEQWSDVMTRVTAALRDLRYRLLMPCDQRFMPAI